MLSPYGGVGGRSSRRRPTARRICSIRISARENRVTSTASEWWRRDCPATNHARRPWPTSEPGIPPVRYAVRSFDRQWIIPDNRLINQPNPELWKSYSERQVYLTALSRTSPSAGPALTFTGLIPDLDHYKGSFGGRVFPLWHDSDATIPNIPPDLLAYLEQRYQRRLGGGSDGLHRRGCGTPGVHRSF